MFKSLDRLRQKPVRYRRNVALFISGGVTLVIAGMWAATLSVNNYRSVAKQSGGPLQNIADDFSDIFTQGKQMLSDANSTLEESFNLSLATTTATTTSTTGTTTDTFNEDKLVATSTAAVVATTTE